jgi:predicted dehydrogenase
MTQHSRRTFLISAAGVAALSLAGKARAQSANDAIRYGLIGCGSRGSVFFEGAHTVCDPDQERAGEAAHRAGIGADHAVTDLRRILDDRDIDAVVIATPDHWHAPAAILACEAGKHVYVEKPASHNFRESQLLLAAARRSNVVVQHGTQQRSRPFCIDAMQKLHEGLIGDVLVAKAWNIQQRKNIGHSKPKEVPPGVDYDMWVGPAEMVPFQPNRFHADWHWWYNFGTGDIGNDGAHELDYARWGMGIDTLPTKATAFGGKYFFDDDQQFPDTATCVFEYPGGIGKGYPQQLIFEMRLWSRNYPYNCDSGVEFYGTKGKMFYSKRGKLIVVGPNNEPILDQRKPEKEPFTHFENFVEAIRTGSRPNADIEEAHRSMALVHLANISLRTGRSITFDPDAEQIVGDAEASEFLTRVYRQNGHWAIPEGA